MPGFPKQEVYSEVSEKIGQLKLQTFDGIADAFNKWAKKEILGLWSKQIWEMK